MTREVPFKDEGNICVITEAIKGGTPVPKTDPPPDVPRGFLVLMKSCYTMAPGPRPSFRGISKFYCVCTKKWRYNHWQLFVFGGIKERLDYIIQIEQKRRKTKSQEYCLVLSQHDDVIATLQRYVVLVETFTSNTLSVSCKDSGGQMTVVSISLSSTTSRKLPYTVDCPCIHLC
jgi:hypothetical protein